MSEAELIQRIREYCLRKRIDTVDRLGSGNDGIVYSTSRHSAIKAFWREDTFERELLCYLRLNETSTQQLGTRVDGERHLFMIPGLIGFDNEFQVIEIDLVSPPFFLDFGKAYLDYRPTYHAESLEYWEEQYKDLWGDERWLIVKRLMASLAAIGIYYVDPTPRNIHFGDGDT